MQKAIDIRNIRTAGAAKTEKAIYIFLGILAYIGACLKEKFAPAVDGTNDGVVDNKKTVRRAVRDKDTRLADFCAVSVALTVASVIYVTLLFCVGEGHTNGIASELLISGTVYAVVYGIIRFFTTI